MSEISAAMDEFTRRVRAGGFELQRCCECGQFQWPPREICNACWSDILEWTEADRTATIIASTLLNVSHERFFSERLPWRVGTVKLGAGPVAYAHLHEKAEEGARVKIDARIDYAGRAVLIALPEDVRLEEDKNLKELVSQMEE
ncbi:MAG: zinc ribbon domain-containing protein [Parvularculaceae bacterium]